MSIEAKIYNRAKEDFLSGMTITKVAEKYQINRKQLSKQLREDNIPTSKKDRYKVLISQETLDKAVEMLKEGNLLTHVARELEVPRTTLTTSLEKIGYREQPKLLKTHKETDIDNIILLFESGWTAKEIGKIYDVGDYTVLRRLNDAGIDTQRYWRKHDVDESIFENIDTEEKAYWFGFLYADGCVMNNLSPILELTLARIDKNHIQKFKEFMKSSAPILDRDKSSIDSVKTHYSSRISICSKKIVEDLISHGLVERKTFIKQWPKEEDIPDDLIHHFIRGYFDGNGSFGHTDKSQWFSIVTGSKNFANSMSNYLFNTFGRKFTPCYKNVSHIYDLRTSSTVALVEMYYYIYHEATIYLDRKEEKFTRFIKDKVSNYKSPLLG